MTNDDQTEPEKEKEFTIRPLAANELGFCLDLAAAEGWNPGLMDAPPFAAADPGAFLVGELDGEKIGCISAVRYPTYGFIGFYIVRPQWRGMGYGRRLWDSAIERLGTLPIGLDAAAAQQKNYEKSGFVKTYGTIRYLHEGRLARPHFASSISIVPLREIDDEIRAFDHDAFGAARDPFLQAWTGQKDTVTLVARDILTNVVLGYATGRECREGTKIGPLFSTRLDVAALLFDALLGKTRSPWYMDVPDSNVSAMALAEERDLTKVSQTARMWRGTPPQQQTERVYAVTSLELG